MKGKFVLIAGLILPLLFVFALGCEDTVLYPYSPVNYLIPSNEELYQPANPTTSVDLTKIPYVDENGLFYTFRYDTVGLYIPSPFVPYPDSTTECFQIYRVNPDKLPSNAVFMYWNVTNGYDGAMIELYTLNTTYDDLIFNTRACTYDLSYDGTRCPALTGNVWFGCSGSECYVDLNKYGGSDFLYNNIKAGKPVAVRICAQRYGGTTQPYWSCINSDYYQVIDVLFAPAKECTATLSLDSFVCGNSDDGTGYASFTVDTGCEEDNPNTGYFIQQPTNVSYTLNCYDSDGNQALTKTERGIMTYIDTQYGEVSGGSTVNKNLAYCNLSVTAIPFYGSPASVGYQVDCSGIPSPQPTPEGNNVTIQIIRPLYPVLYLCGQNYIVRSDPGILNYIINITKASGNVTYGIDPNTISLCDDGSCDVVSTPLTCDPNYIHTKPCFGNCANCSGEIEGGY